MTTRSQMIVRRIREGVLQGEYQGGMRMNEIELAESLQVSRTPIRAALSILATEGLLRYTPNSGFVVHTFTSKDIENIYELRSTLSGLAARIATQRGLSEEQVERLQVLIAKSRVLVDHREWTPDVRRDWQAYNDEFHTIIDRAADNPHLEAALQRTRDIPVLKEIRFRYIDPDQLTMNLHAHTQIFEAVTRGQQSRAESLTREHVYENGQRIVQQWRKVEALRGTAGELDDNPVRGTEERPFERAMPG